MNWSVFFKSSDYWYIIASSFCFTVFGILFLMFCKNTQVGWLKKYLGITSGKSTTNAVLLGGLPVSLTINVGVVLLNQWFVTDSVETHLLYSWAFSGSIVILYGYIDDKFELRPIVKLFSQFICVLTYSLLASHYLHRSFSSFAFMFLMFFGLGSVNGCNLLDGLDTLTVKLGSVGYGLFICLGIWQNSPTIVMASTVCISSLFAFYIFNREPAKVYMGEIGGSFIGFTFLSLSSILFFKMRQSHSIPQSLAVSLLPLTLPMVELGISFLRRIYNKRSPFKGDRFHVHHILRNYHKLKPSNVGTVMALGYASLIGVNYLIGKVIFDWHLAAVYVTTVLSLCASYIFLGASYWQGEDTLDFSPRSLFNSLRKKDVMVIETHVIEEFQISIVDEEDQAKDSDDDIAA